MHARPGAGSDGGSIGHPADERTIHVDVRAVGRALAGLIAVLLLANVVALTAVDTPDGAITGDHPLATAFLLDRELNVPTLIATVQLLAVAGLAALHARVTGSSIERLPTEPGRLRSERWRWGGLAVIGVYLAADEFFSLHERLLTNETLLALDLPGWFVFRWLLVGIPAVVVVGFGYLPWVLRRPPRVRTGLLLGGALFAFGIVGMELIGGIIRSTIPATHPLYAVSVATEETCELSGIAVVLTTLLGHLLARIDGAGVGLSGDGAGWTRDRAEAPSS